MGHVRRPGNGQMKTDQLVVRPERAVEEERVTAAYDVRPAPLARAGAEIHEPAARFGEDGQPNVVFIRGRKGGHEVQGLLSRSRKRFDPDATGLARGVA